MRAVYRGLNAGIAPSLLDGCKFEAVSGRGRFDQSAECRDRRRQFLADVVHPHEAFAAQQVTGDLGFAPDFAR